MNDAQTDGLADLAREAYAHGWALSGGPMTDRVRAGCEAAVLLAEDCADRPDVLEVTLKLGQLEGVWAKVYERRETLIRQHVAAVTKQWKNILGGLDLKALIRTYRATAGLHGDQQANDLGSDARHAEARTAALGFFNNVHDAPGYDELRTVVAAALQAADVEGHAAGRALHRHHATESVVEDAADDSFAIDSQAYLDQLDNLDQWPRLADQWIQRLVSGSATDLGNVLATATADGASYEDMLAAAEDLLQSGDLKAVSTLLDFAMSDAINNASVNLYASEGLASYDVLTAGDSRVCVRCQDAEADSPYPAGTQSPVPIHPMCRCAVAPSLSGISKLAAGV